MTILSLRDNRIVRIPDDIGRMPNLQVINLACNRSVFQFMKIYFPLSGTINLLFLNTLLTMSYSPRRGWGGWWYTPSVWAGFACTLKVLEFQC